MANTIFREEAKSESGAWVGDIEDDVKDFCAENFGEVLHIKLQRAANRNDTDGRIFVKFRTQDFAKTAYQSLQGRLFNGRNIAAEYVPEGQYNQIHRLT